MEGVYNYTQTVHNNQLTFNTAKLQSSYSTYRVYNDGAIVNNFANGSFKQNYRVPIPNNDREIVDNLSFKWI